MIGRPPSASSPSGNSPRLWAAQAPHSGVGGPCGQIVSALGIAFELSGHYTDYNAGCTGEDSGPGNRWMQVFYTPSSTPADVAKPRDLSPL